MAFDPKNPPKASGGFYFNGGHVSDQDVNNTLMGVMQTLKQGRGVAQHNIDLLNTAYGDGFDAASALGISPDRVIKNGSPVEAYDATTYGPSYGVDYSEKKTTQEFNALEDQNRQDFARSMGQTFSTSLSGVNNQDFLKDLAKVSRNVLGSNPGGDYDATKHDIDHRPPQATQQSITKFLGGGGRLGYTPKGTATAGVKQSASYTPRNSVFDEAAYLAANPDVAAAVANGTMPSAKYHFDNFGAAEIASGARPEYRGMVPGTTVGEVPVLDTGTAVGDGPRPDYASLYHEMRGIGTDFGVLGMQVPDYTKTPVSSAQFRNAHHYIDPATGETNKDLLREHIRTGKFRFNPDFYAQQNPDLAAAGITSGIDLMNHYIDYGFREGRAPGIDAPVYVNSTQTDAQAAAGFDPIAAKLLDMGETPSWGTTGFGFGTADGHGVQNKTADETNHKSADEIKDEIDQILSDRHSSVSAGNFNDNVQSNIAQVIADDSELMKLAATRARQVANSRGMLNSSMAVNAAQDAILNVAIPIGSQQAGQNFQANENARGFEYSNRLLGTELDWRGDQAALDRSHDIDMLGRELDWRGGQSALDRAHQTDLLGQELGWRSGESALDRDLTLTQQDREIGFRSSEASLDRELQERLQTWNLNATEADNAARQVYAAQSLLQNTLVNINANTNLSADQRSTQIAQAQADFDLAMYLVEQIYRIDLDWAA